MYSDADCASLHVRAADEAVRIGAGPAAESYLRVEPVLGAAASTGAEAVHPGYGFLSENAAFAEACRRRRARVGRAPARGDAGARRQGARQGAGGVGRGADPTRLPRRGRDRRGAAASGRGVGYPLLVKASAGGGGRGMRVVARAGRARRGAGDRAARGRGLVRRRPAAARAVPGAPAPRRGPGARRRPRHGRPPRRARVQRPAAAPEADRGVAVAGGVAALRTAMGEAALRLVRAAGYEGAGTVEFLLDATGTFFFLEVNARLQVEHPVTEAVTGLDLVEQQLRVAAGEPLGFGQADVRLEGHAMELRVVAEDPLTGFLPSTGVVTALDLPGDVRVDTGIEAGSTISPYYDSLLAKVIAHGADRAVAVAALRGRARRDADRGRRDQRRPARRRPRRAGVPGRRPAHGLPRGARGRRAAAADPGRGARRGRGSASRSPDSGGDDPSLPGDPWRGVASWRVGRLAEPVRWLAGDRPRTTQDDGRRRPPGRGRGAGRRRERARAPVATRRTAGRSRSATRRRSSGPRSAPGESRR